jgi:hypothetical protein
MLVAFAMSPQNKVNTVRELPEISPTYSWSDKGNMDLPGTLVETDQ